MQSFVPVIALATVLINEIVAQTCPALPSTINAATTTGPAVGGSCTGGICFISAGIDSCFPCKDASSNCASYIANGFCSSSFYTTEYKRGYCAKSCGYCTSSSSTGCSDTSANCASWAANGFCTNTFYPATQRASLCGATCSLC